MRTEIFIDHRETRRSSLFFAGLVLLAWALLIAWQRSAFAGLLGHEALEDHSLTFTVRLAAFLLSWLLMTLAMMLPGSLPMLLHTMAPAGGRATAGQRALDAGRAALVLAGYLLPWLLFGFFAYLGDSQLHHLAEHSGPLSQYAALIPPAILLLAGLYQLSPFKQRSLALCRSAAHAELLPTPAEHAKQAEQPEGHAPFAQGLRLGGVCIASCGSLMLLMFALGHHRLDLMLLLSAILVAERLTAWGPRLAWGIGATLVVASGIWMFVA